MSLVLLILILLLIFGGGGGYYGYNRGYYGPGPLGGLVGVLAAGLWWSRRHRLHFFDTVDFVAPLVPIGLGLGRLGNFINGELWGKPSDVPWAMIFPHAPDRLPRHPSQLYELLLEGVAMFVVLWLVSLKPRADSRFDLN